MSIGSIILTAGIAGLFFYLSYVLIYPEKF